MDEIISKMKQQSFRWLSSSLEAEKQIREQTFRVDDALYGGTCDAYRTNHNCGPNERILCYDFNSLYPFINYTGKVPVGGPKRIVIGHSDCSLIDPKTFEGFIKCHIVSRVRVILFLHGK